MSDRQNNSSPQVFGTLSSLNPRTADDFLITEHTTKIIIGRKNECSIRVTNTKCSKEHCEITVNDATSFTVKDSSANGVFLNGDLLGKNIEKAATFGDEIVLLKKESVGDAEFIGFRLKSVSLKRVEPAHTTGPKRSSKMESKLSEELQCLICFEVLYQPVSLLPCLHNFCGGCFSEWHNKANEFCPNCREPAKSVKKNALLNNLISIYLEENPDQCRSAAELKDIDDMNKFKKDLTLLQNENRTDVCRQCARNIQGFKCTPTQQHVQCVRCKGFMPSRNTLAQQCHCCRNYHCNLYWKSGVKCGSGLVLAEQCCTGPFARIPASAFNHNAFEQKLLTDYLKQKKLTEKQLGPRLLDKMDRGKWVLNIEGHQGVVLQKKSPLCDECVEPIWAELLYKFRTEISSELPVQVQSRGDCWYGRTCRTQGHNSQHAEKYNHICESKR